MRLTFCKAAGTVTGSSFLVETDQRQVFIVHGEIEAQQNFAGLIQKKFIREIGETY